MTKTNFLVNILLNDNEFEIRKADTVIILSSKAVDDKETYEIHGAFPTVESAVLYIGNCASLGALAIARLVSAFTATQNPMMHTTIFGTRWTITTAPVHDTKGKRR